MNTTATKTNQRQPRQLGARERFRIIKFTNRSGTVSFRVVGNKHGNGNRDRVRENYRTMEEANCRKIELNLEAANIVDAIAPKVTHLTSDQLKDAEHASTRQREKFPGKSLLWCVEYCITNYREPVKETTVQAAYDLFIAARQDEDCRPDTIRNLKGRVGMFAGIHGAKNVSAITPGDCRDFVYRPGTSGRNRINDRLAVSNFLNWCMEDHNQFVAINHMEAVKRPRVTDIEPQVLTLGDCRKLLAAARDYRNGAVLPYIVVSLFAGLRPTEATRITWNHINLNERTITITGEIAKGHGRRVVSLPDVAVDWLLPMAPKHPRFAITRREFNRVKYLAGFRPESAKGDDLKLRPWVSDYLRHTAISMYLKLVKHIGEVAMWAGNSPAMIQKHYHGLVTPDVTEYWALTPDSVKGEIVEFPVKARAKRKAA